MKQTGKQARETGAKWAREGGPRGQSMSQAVPFCRRRARSCVSGWVLNQLSPLGAGESAIAEAVRLAQELSTDGSPSFLNGLLSKALSIKETNS